MAISDHNILVKGLHGKIGNIIFRRRGNKTTAYVRTDREKPFTANEKRAQKNFSIAVALAKNAMNIESEKLRFEKLAKSEGRESAYSCAVSFFMKEQSKK
jgi:hypothetical protein